MFHKIGLTARHTAVNDIEWQVVADIIPKTGGDIIRSGYHHRCLSYFSSTENHPEIGWTRNVTVIVVALHPCGDGYVNNAYGSDGFCDKRIRTPLARCRGSLLRLPGCSWMIRCCCCLRKAQRCSYKGWRPDYPILFVSRILPDYYWFSFNINPGRRNCRQFSAHSYRSCWCAMMSSRCHQLEAISQAPGIEHPYNHEGAAHYRKAADEYKAKILRGRAIKGDPTDLNF